MFRIGVEFGHDVGAWSLAGQVPVISAKVRAVRRGADVARRGSPPTDGSDQRGADVLADGSGPERIGASGGGRGGASSGASTSRDGASGAERPVTGRPQERASAGRPTEAAGDGGGEAITAYHALGVDQSLAARSRGSPTAALFGDRDVAAAVGLFAGTGPLEARQANGVQRAIAAAVRRRQRQDEFSAVPDTASAVRVLATG